MRGGDGLLSDGLFGGAASGGGAALRAARLLAQSNDMLFRRMEASALDDKLQSLAATAYTLNRRRAFIAACSSCR